MLAGINYAPLLRTKPAEVKAYQTLTNVEKASILPVFLAKPWQNANSFQKTIDRVAGAAGSCSFGFGLDLEYSGRDGKQPAQSEFDALFNPSGGYRAYYDCIRNIEGAVPVFIGGGTVDQILIQLGNADALHRGLIVRFTRSEITPVLSLAGSVPPLPEDTVFVVDAGWGRDILQLQQWTNSTVQRIITAIPTAEIVVMASTFPDSFSSIIGHGTVSMLEDQLFSTIRANHNQADLTYGDWATTRPSQSGGGGIIPPRIDIPMLDSCNIFRADEGESYSDMAALAMNHECFANLPECYGRSLIMETSEVTGITGTQRATEARINIHLTKRAGTSIQNNAEEAYVD